MQTCKSAPQSIWTKLSRFDSKQFDFEVRFINKTSTRLPESMFLRYFVVFLFWYETFFCSWSLQKLKLKIKCKSFQPECDVHQSWHVSKLGSMIDIVDVVRNGSMRVSLFSYIFPTHPSNVYLF